MKSIYIDNHLHVQLKSIAAIEKKTLMEIVKKFLEVGVKKELIELKKEDIAKMAMIGKSFNFLDNAEEDVYTSTDGEAISQ